MNVLVDDGHLSNIAKAIRAKLGVETTYKPSEMAMAITKISGGGETAFEEVPGFFLCSNSAPAFEDGWIGPFSNGSQYIVPRKNGEIVKPDWRQPFEIQVAFQVSSSVSHSQVLFGAQQHYYYCPSIELSSNLQGIWCGFTTNGSNWDYSLSFSQEEFPILLDTEIIVRARWDGVNYSVTLTCEDTTVSKSITPSAVHYYNASYHLEFGGISTSSNHCATYVKINLRKTRMLQGGEVLWGEG